MYFVYLDGKKIFDPQIEDYQLEDPVLELEVNNAGEFTFTVPPTHPFYDSFKPLVSTIEVYRDEEWLWQGRVIETTETFNNRLKVYCEGALAYLNDSIQRQKEFNDVTPMGYVQVLLDNHNQDVPKNRQILQGAVTVTDPNNSLYRYTNYNCTLQELKEDLIDDLGGYLRIRKFEGQLYLDCLKEYGVTNSQVIEFGENLVDLSKGFDFTELATVFIPLGAKKESEDGSTGEGVLDEYITIEDVNNGRDYLVSAELNNNYGNIWKVVEWSQVHIPELLLTKAKKYIEDLQFGEMVIEAKAYDMNYSDEEFEAFSLGDRVRVISKPHGLDRYFPITKLTLHLNQVSENTLTLGGYGEPSITGITNQVTINTGKVREEIREPNALIEQAVRQATELIRQGLNGHVVVNENEILIMDTDDPATAKYVWRWNMGGLGYSNNGYNGPFETAITMDGTIVGKFIAANSIAADQIDINYRTTVYDQITNAELQANLYTDEHLGNYYTKSQVETQLKTMSDSILMYAQQNMELYVNGKLSGNYYTKAQIDLQLDSITSSVDKKFTNYSTTIQMNSAIQQKANEITTTVSQTYATKTALGNLETTVKSVENKVTADGIFTTINSGLTGSKSITTTKYSLTKSGITIQGGGITIKNNAGTSVLYADTSGNVTIRGNFYHYNSSGYKAVDIIQNKINFYSWYTSGDYVGSIGAVKNSSGSNSYIELWCDYYDSIVLGYAPSGYKPDGGSYTLNSIMELDRNGISFIKGTTNGTFSVGKSSITVKNGLITGWSYGSGSYIGGTVQAGAAKLTFTSGMLTSTSYDSVTTGTINIGNGSLTFGSGGVLTKATVPNGVSSSFTLGNYNVTFNRGTLTSASSITTYNGTVRINGVYMTFTRGILTSAGNY